MNNLNAVAFSGQSKEDQGTELEIAYANVFIRDGYEAKVIGGKLDGGFDVYTNHPLIRLFQCKSSLKGVMEHLIKGSRLRAFIPVALSDPGKYTADEIAKSLSETGGFVGIDIPNREKIMSQITQSRDLILANGGRFKDR